MQTPIKAAPQVAMRRCAPRALAVACVLALAAGPGCAPVEPWLGTGEAPGPLGTVIGTLVIEFVPPSNVLSQEQLRQRFAFYQLVIESRSAIHPQRFLNLRRKAAAPTPFSVSLGAGDYAISRLHLSNERGPGLTHLLPRLSGFNVALEVVFPAEENALTYIGRLRVRVPRDVNGLVDAISVVVEDASQEDLAHYAQRMGAAPRNVRIALAEVRIEEEVEVGGFLFE